MSLVQKDPLIAYVQEQARATPFIERVILFGSRARGDAKERSDYDLAFGAPNASDADWARFCLNLEENAPTLCKLDLVRLGSPMRKELRNHILSEGKTIYERK